MAEKFWNFCYVMCRNILPSTGNVIAAKQTNKILPKQKIREIILRKKTMEILKLKWRQKQIKSWRARPLLLRGAWLGARGWSRGRGICWNRVGGEGIHICVCVLLFGRACVCVIECAVRAQQLSFCLCLMRKEVSCSTAETTIIWPNFSKLIQVYLQLT